MFFFTERLLDRKHLLPVCLFLWFFISPAFSQSVNALFLKDGSKVLGLVMGLDSIGGVKIQTTDGSMLSYRTDDIDNIIWSYKQKQPGPGDIYRYADQFRWKYNGLELSDKNYEKYFDVVMYHDYVVGSNQFNIGGAGLVFGVASTMMAALSFDPSSRRQSKTFYAYACSAGVLYCIGGIFTHKGIKRLNNIVKTFNSHEADYVSSNSSTLMDAIMLSPSIMLTGQNDLALGASVSVSF